MVSFRFLCKKKEYTYFPESIHLSSKSWDDVSLELTSSDESSESSNHHNNIFRSLKKLSLPLIFKRRRNLPDNIDSMSETTTMSTVNLKKRNSWNTTSSTTTTSSDTSMTTTNSKSDSFLDRIIESTLKVLTCCAKDIDTECTNSIHYDMDSTSYMYDDKYHRKGRIKRYNEMKKKQQKKYCLNATNDIPTHISLPHTKNNIVRTRSIGEIYRDRVRRKTNQRKAQCLMMDLNNPITDKRPLSASPSRNNIPSTCSKISINESNANTIWSTTSAHPGDQSYPSSLHKQSRKLTLTTRGLHRVFTIGRLEKRREN